MRQNSVSAPTKITYPRFFFLCLYFLFLVFFLFFNWRIITLHNFVFFCHTSTRISHRYTHVPSLPGLPPISLPLPPFSLSQSPCLSSLIDAANAYPGGFSPSGNLFCFIDTGTEWTSHFDSFFFFFREIEDTVPCNEECKTRNIGIWVEGCVVVGKKVRVWESEKSWYP